MLGGYSLGELGSIFAMQAFAGLILFSVFLLMALGLAIIFGQMGVINMAHGEFMILGAYMTWMTSHVFQTYLPSFFGAYFFVAMAIAFIVSGALGLLVEWALIRHLYARPLVWTAIWAVSLHCALTMAYQGMLPMFVSTDLRAPDSSYGALLTSIGLGAALGSLGLARLSDPRFRPALFGISLTGSGISLALMAATSSVAVAITSGFFVGATQAMFMSMALALIQGSVDDQYRGRATSVYQMITMAPMAIFGWGMGGLADVTEPRPLMIVSGLGFMVVMAIFLFASPWLRALFGVRAWVSGSQPATVPALT